MTDQQCSQIVDANETSQSGADAWRGEIHARVAGYKHRRGRRVEGAYSMRFPFPPAEAIVAQSSESETTTLCADVQDDTAPAAPTVKLAPEPVAVRPVVDEIPAETQPPPSFDTPVPSFDTPVNDRQELPLAAPAVTEETPLLLLPPRPRARKKVIAFPRQPTSHEMPFTLAEPVFSDHPRIFDVPEELEALPATPFLEGLQFQPSREHDLSSEAAERQDPLPLPPAPTSRRFAAAIIDMGMVGIAAAVTCASAYHMLLGVHIPGKPLMIGAIAAAAVLWSTYEYLFLTHAGQTIGMRFLHLRLSTFQGRPLSSWQRHARVIGVYLSAVSLGMGVLWAFVDLDGLCWQDRISGTYPVVRN